MLTAVTGARGIRRATRAPNNAASAYWGAIDATGTVPAKSVVNAGKICRDQWQRRHGHPGFQRNGGNAKESAAVTALALALRIGMLVRIDGHCIVTGWNSAVMMHRAIRMRVRCSFRLCLMHMRGGGTFFGQAMRGGMSERQCGMRREHAECVKRGDNERRADTKSLPQRSTHRGIKNESEEASE